MVAYMTENPPDGDGNSLKGLIKLSTIKEFANLFKADKEGPRGASVFLRTCFASIGVAALPTFIIVRGKLYKAVDDFQETFLEFDLVVQALLIIGITVLAIVWALLGFGLQQKNENASYISLFLSGIGLSVLVFLGLGTVIRLAGL